MVSWGRRRDGEGTRLNAALVLDVDSVAKDTFPCSYAFWVPSNAIVCAVIAWLRNYPERIARRHIHARLPEQLKHQRGVQPSSDLRALMASRKRSMLVSCDGQLP
jgi:hypothetical protein